MHDKVVARSSWRAGVTREQWRSLLAANLGWLFDGFETYALILTAGTVIHRLDPHTPNLVQFAVARLMRQGAFDAHLRTIRAEHAKRCTQMVATLQRLMPPGAIRFARPQGGLYLWCRLGPGLSATALHDRALAAGVTFVPGPAFYPDPAGDSEIRLCFTSVVPSTLEESVRRLARCIGEVRLTA